MLWQKIQTLHWCCLEALRMCGRIQRFSLFIAWGDNWCDSLKKSSVKIRSCLLYVVEKTTLYASHWIETQEWNYMHLVSPAHADGKLCVWCALSHLPLIGLRSFSPATDYPCKLFLSRRTNYSAVSWALVNAQHDAAWKWLLLLGNSWTERI